MLSLEVLCYDLAYASTRCGHQMVRFCYDSSLQLHFLITNMAVFTSKKFRSSADANTIAARYRSALAKHPFALFGLPFIATMVAGSFFLTPATAIRYEKHDRRVQRVSKEDELGIGKAGRRVDMKEEYYVSSCLLFYEPLQFNGSRRLLRNS